MKTLKSGLIAFFVAALAALGGCGSYQSPSNVFLPKPVNTYEATDDGERLVGLSLSGGGSRAACLAAGVLEQLYRINVTVDGRSTTVLGELDYISSVSSGSIAAMDYCLNIEPEILDDPEKFNPFMQAMRRRMRRNFWQRHVWRSIYLFPMTILSATTMYSRILNLAEVYEEQIYDHQTYRRLFEKYRTRRAPKLFVNATDLNLGRKFIFTQLPSEAFQIARHNSDPVLKTKTFDTLGSDLAMYRVSHAVCASSSFPLIFNAMAVRGYSAGGAKAQDTYLMDGGLYDHTGVESLYQRFSNIIRRRIEAGEKDRIKGAVIVALGCSPRVDEASDFYFGSELNRTYDILLRRYKNPFLLDLDDRHLRMLREMVNRHNLISFEELASGRFYINVVQLNLHDLTDSDSLVEVLIDDQPVTVDVQKIRTHLRIDRSEAYALYDVARTLLTGEEYGVSSTVLPNRKTPVDAWLRDFFARGEQ